MDKQLDELMVCERPASYGSSDARTYRDLRAWQAAMDLTELCYRLTASLPADETYGLRSQIRRSSVSIPANIAEGWGRDSDGDFNRALSIAFGSLRELETEILLCGRLNYCDQSLLERALTKCDELGKLLYKLRDAVQRRRTGQR